MIGNNPVGRTDLLGLLVTATYDIRKQTFEAKDEKDSFTCSKNECSCGDNKIKNTDSYGGPIPTETTYKIYKRVKKRNSDFNGLGTAWILDAQDGVNAGDDITPNGRFSFRIHLWVDNDKDPSGRHGSYGCIVLNPDCYARFDKLVSNTKPGKKTIIKSPKTEGVGKNEKISRDANGIVFEKFDETEELGTLTVK